MNHLTALRKFIVLGFSDLGWAIFLIVLGSRLTVFSYAGSPLPFYDQWIAEFNNTLIAILTGRGWETLLTFHNEHLILTSKLLTLVGYSLNGYWDVPFLVLCSAGVRALTAALTFELVANAAPPKTKIFLWLLCAVIFATPYSGYNCLNGMQVCFYLADFALLLSLRATVNWAGPAAGGLALIGGTLFGLISLTSAVAIPASTLAAHLFQRRSRPGFWPAWIISAMIALGFIIVSRHSSGSVAIAAIHQSITLKGAATFCLQLIAWPIGTVAIGGLMILLAAIALVFSVKCNDRHNVTMGGIIGLGVFAALNAAIIAINRDPSELHMRHFDMIALFPFTLLALGLRLAERNAFRRPALLLMGAVALGYVFYGGNLIRNVSWPYLKAAHETRTAALEHYRTLITKEDLHEESKRLHVLLNQSGHAFFDDPIGRFSLHPLILESTVKLNYRPLALLSPEIIPGRKPSLFSWLTRQLIAYGWLLGVLGVVLGAAAIRHDLGRSDETTKP